MKINIEKTIEFFDNPKEKGHTTSIVGIIGEDLNAYSFKDYMEKERGATVEILTNPVTTGYKKGKRLDRWIYVKENNNETLY